MLQKELIAFSSQISLLLSLRLDIPAHPIYLSFLIHVDINFITLDNTNHHSST